MASDLLLGFGEDDEELGAEVLASLSAAGFRVGILGDPTTAAAPLALLLVTRAWSAERGLNRAVDALASAGVRTLLVWWDEDVPSDDLSDHVREDEIFYACFLPRAHRAAALVELLRGAGGGAA